MMDEQQFSDEVRAMERMLYRIARGHLPGWEECADAVQEALTKAWTKRHTVSPEYFRAWMVRIVINECHNINRRKKREMPVAEVREMGYDASRTDSALGESILALPEKLRIPVLLHYLEGFPLTDIARILHVPKGTVKSRLCRARKELRYRLKAEEE